jgi:predicted amidophosphoribosyltransferase
MLKVCPSCQGIYELKEVICPTCKAELVPRKGNEAATRSDYVKPEPVSPIRDWFLLILVPFFIS